MEHPFIEIKQRVEAACIACGRDPQSVKLVAVSKTKPAEAVLDVHRAGGDLFGENYIQEAVDKIDQLSDLPVTWHFIGHLQSNKARFAVGRFDLIHSVGSLKLAREIDKQARKIGKVQKILLQVNIAGEDTKSGSDPSGAIDLAKEISTLENVSIHGLMSMPPFYDEPDLVRPYFKATRELRDKIDALKIPGVSMKELSMGMTGDFQVAIEEGSTFIRIGTAIFGKRDYKNK